MTSKFNKEDVLFYLEEMVQMEMTSSIEEDVYYSLKQGKKVTREQLGSVLKRMKKWYNASF
ncbi:hypothetical protein [Lysinibacillus fusiformis]|uniref:hypothetical protein n=1 Tax=Lysinibacillus fusiformis TaxID=28031 RepID=UPI00263BD896|nr:hypothetical protein [Lysinibacillus fusiformis]MDC6267337.1 hypothetical protein [Lysinibacillus sphaericus]MDN4968229.1 hypothetical protein [Lysinibacillus fusiformis]MDN4968403.1 hypothetical protein [Lysinibacillus fusiformis]